MGSALAAQMQTRRFPLTGKLWAELCEFVVDNWDKKDFSLGPWVSKHIRTADPLSTAAYLQALLSFHVVNVCCLTFYLSAFRPNFAADTLRSCNRANQEAGSLGNSLRANVVGTAILACQVTNYKSLCVFSGYVSDFTLTHITVKGQPTHPSAIKTCSGC